MLKRLLTAVLVLGLFMVLSGTAISAPTDYPGEGPKSDQLVKGPTSITKKSILTTPGFVTPLQRPDVSDLGKNLLTQHPVIPGAQSADTTVCSLISWPDWANATFFISFPRRSNHNNQQNAMRYNGPSAPGYKIKVLGAYNWIYRVREGVAMDAQAGITVRVFDDAGGLPGTLLYTETFMVPEFPNQFNYLYFPFTTEVVVTGTYHISFGPDLAGPTTDTIVFTSDDAGFPGGGTATPSGHGSSYSLALPGWLTSLAYFGSTFDPAFDQISDQCEFYSVCYDNNTHIPAPGYIGHLVDVPADYWADGSTLNGVSQYWLATGPETLKTVRLRHFDYSGSYPGLFYSLASTNGLSMSIYPDDGSGNLDYSGGPLATVVKPGGPTLFPTTGLAANGYNSLFFDFSSFNLVLFGGYHIALSVTSDLPADGVFLWPMTYETAGPFFTDGTGGSVNFTAPGATWQRMYLNTTWMSDPGAAYGIDYAFGGLRPTLCKDEFSLCDVQPSYMDAATRLLYMDNCGDPIHYGSRNGIAGKFSGGQVNRVDKVRFQLIDEFNWDGAPDVPNSVRVSVYQSINAGTPSVVWTTVLTDAQLNYYPGWTEVVIPGGVIVVNEWFVAVEPLFTLDGDTEWLYFMRERVGDTPLITGQPNGGMWVKLCADDLWYQNNTIAAADNFICESEFCSIPASELVCGAADDYPTNAHDFGRTGHSNVALSDAYCDLNLKWTFTDAGFGSTAAGGGAIANNQPIIYEDYVVSVQNSKINILDLNTGGLLATLTGSGAPYYVSVSLVRTTPTIKVINVGGIPKPVLFYGGGSSIMAVVMEPGFPALWDLRSANAAAKGYPIGAVSSGFSNWLSPVVATLAGDDVLYFGTQNSQVYCADAETGVRIWGPTTLVSNPVRNLAFDGTNLYTATIAAPPVIPNGDVYKIDGASGAIMWQLSTAGGYKGASVPGWAGSTNETFADQLAVHDGQVWTVSAWYVPEFDDEGTLYNINAANGAVNSFAGTQHFYQGGGLTVGANLMIDAARIIVAGGTTWSSTPLGGTMIAHNRFTGAIAWVSDAGTLKTTNGNLSNGFMTCEPGGAADHIFIFNTGGYMSCFNGNTGSEIFNRRIDYLSLGFNSQGAGGAISDGGIVVFGTFAGQVIALEKGINRGRLEIMDYTPTTSVSFGNAVSYPVNLADIYTNTGCATVTGTWTISTTSNGSLPGVSEWSGFDVVNRSASIADQLTQNSVKAFKGSGLVSVNMETVVDDASRASMNRAALAVPIYLNNAATTPFVVNPLDTFDILLDVNQSLIPRGPNKFYISFDSDDPDFFLNDVTKDPEITVTLVGGCLIDTTHLHFGAGSANLQAVVNSGRLGTGDWNPTPGNFDIQGDAVSFYQGTYVYGVSRSRVALNSQDWWSGGGEADSWVSMQADPNRCSDDCKPALQTSVSLGSVSTDGITYSPLTGNLVCKDYIDSVMMYDNHLGAAQWNWLNFETAYFDNDSTMGLYVSTSTFGVVDAPVGFEELDDVTVEVMKVKTRNGQALNGWKFGVGIDYDVVNPDTTAHAPSISSAYTYGANGAAPRSVWGITKLPFGGGCSSGSYAPLKNARALARGQSMTTGTTLPNTARGNGFVDSSYFWMSLPSGGTSQGSMNSADDQDAFATIVEHDFAPGGDSIMFAVAHWAKFLVSSPQSSSNYTNLANLLNKWMGFGRGDVNGDGIVNLADIIYLADFVAASGPGPIPFAHLGDVNGDALTNAADVTYLVNYYFHYGPCPVGEFIIQ